MQKNSNRNCYARRMSWCIMRTQEIVVMKEQELMSSLSLPTSLGGAVYVSLACSQVSHAKSCCLLPCCCLIGLSTPTLDSQGLVSSDVGGCHPTLERLVFWLLNRARRNIKVVDIWGSEICNVGSGRNFRHFSRWNAQSLDGGNYQNIWTGTRGKSKQRFSFEMSNSIQEQSKQQQQTMKHEAKYLHPRTGADTTLPWNQQEEHLKEEEKKSSKRWSIRLNRNTLCLIPLKMPGKHDNKSRWN